MCLIYNKKTAKLQFKLWQRSKSVRRGHNFLNDKYGVYNVYLPNSNTLHWSYSQKKQKESRDTHNVHLLISMLMNMH